MPHARPVSMPSHPLHEFADRDPQRLRDDLDVPQGDVPLAAFDSADVGAVQLALVGKGLLRKPECHPLFPHALTLFEPVDRDVENDVVDLGLRDATLEELGEEWLSIVVPHLESLDLELPVETQVDGDEFTVTREMLPETRGRNGSHTDAWFDLYDEFTRTYRELGRTETTKIMDPPE
jgi:hypothetical protein